MDNELLQEIAECVLSQLVGEGRWYKHEERRRFAKIDNPLMGLSVGDVVFTYNSDAEEIQEKRVVAIFHGIGYVAHYHRVYGPSLEAISDECYGKTVKEAAEANREEIELDIAYAEQRYDRMTKVKEIIGQ